MRPSDLMKHPRNQRYLVIRGHVTCLCAQASHEEGNTVYIEAAFFSAIYGVGYVL